MSLTSAHYPDLNTFQKLAKSDAQLVPVYRRLVSDALTPVSAFHKIDSGRCACLFESVVGGEKVGRYSFLATDPFFEIEAYGKRVTTNAYSGVSAGGTPTLVTRQSDCRQPTGGTSPKRRGRQGGSSPRTATILQRRGRLCRLRYGPILRESAPSSG